MEARFEYWDAFKNLRSLVRRGSFVSRGKRRGEGEKKEKVIDGGSTKTTVDRFRGPGIVIEASIRLQFASKLRPFFFYSGNFLAADLPRRSIRRSILRPWPTRYILGGEQACARNGSNVRFEMYAISAGISIMNNRKERNGCVKIRRFYRLHHR